MNSLKLRETADWAEYYIQHLGMILCPLAPGTKGPPNWGWSSPAGYQDSSTWWRDYPDYGMAAFLPASRLVSLDVDAAEYAIPLLAELGIDLMALRLTTPCIIGNPSGFRLLFKAPEGLILPDRNLKWSNLIRSNNPSALFCLFELLANGQNCLPPTIHPTTGKPYFWENPPQEGFPALPGSLLELWLSWDAGYKAMLESACPLGAGAGATSRGARTEQQGGYHRRL